MKLNRKVLTGWILAIVSAIMAFVGEREIQAQEKRLDDIEDRINKLEKR